MKGNSDRYGAGHVQCGGGEDGPNRTGESRFRSLAERSDATTCRSCSRSRRRPPPRSASRRRCRSPLGTPRPWRSTAPGLLEDTGIEDLTFDLENSSAGCAVFLQQAYGMLVQGSGSAKVQFQSSSGSCGVPSARSASATRATLASSGPNHEGIDLYEDCCWNLVENNTCMRGGFPMIILGDWKGGCSGNVVGYNYCANLDTGSEIAGGDISVNHGPHNMMNLFEGNVGIMFQSDGYFGSASHNTVFRNWFSAHPS